MYVKFSFGMIITCMKRKIMTFGNPSFNAQDLITEKHAESKNHQSGIRSQKASHHALI